MRREIGASAGILALLAVLFHTQFPPTTEAPGGSHGRNEKDAKPATESWQPVEGPWLASHSFFASWNGWVYPNLSDNTKRVKEDDAEFLTCLKALRSPEDDNSCRQATIRKFLGMQRIGPEWDISSVVATVADPLHTRLPLFADEQIEAISRSAQRSGWEFAAQWLPWLDRFDPTQGDISERRKQRALQREQETVPGLLIFRSSTSEGGEFPKKALFIFVVPETPTAGISRVPFYAAMHLAAAVSPTKIGILGPSFSGSMAGMARVFEEWFQHHPCEQVKPIVYSGSMSSWVDARAFEGAVQGRCSSFKFRSTIAPDDEHSEALAQLLGAYNISSADAAYLAEDETAYGTYGVKTMQFRNRGIRTYAFPRDIAHVRNAYQEATQPTQLPNLQPEPSINFSLKDPNSGEDSIPIFSNAHTPVTENEEIASIAEDLRRRHIRLVYIAATNGLDALFLTRYFRVQCPDIRVVIREPDILFIPAASRDPLTGTMFLSTYPMFPEGNEWLTDPSGRARNLVFPSSAAQGMFNALQFLLHDLGAPEVLPLGFGQPGRDHPGLWLLILNRSGFEPLALFDPKVKATDPHSTWFPEGGKARELQDSEPPPLSWMIATFLLAGAAALGWLQIDGKFWTRVTAVGQATLAPAVAMCLSLSATLFIIMLPVLSLRFSSLWRFPWEVWSGVAGTVAGVSLIAFTYVSLIWLRQYLNKNPGSQEETKQLKRAAWKRVLPLFLVTLSMGGLCLVLQPANPPSDPTDTWDKHWMLEQWFVSSLAAVMFGLTAWEGWKLVWKSFDVRDSGTEEAGRKKALRAYAFLAAGVFVYLISIWVCVCFFAEPGLNAPFFARFRAIHLFSGSSPALPLALWSILFFGVGGYYMHRFEQAGNAPPELSFEEIGADSSEAAARLRDWKDDLKKHYEAVNQWIVATTDLDQGPRRKRLLLCLSVTTCCGLVLQGYPFAFESLSYNFALTAGYALMLFSLTACCDDMWHAWGELRDFLGLVESLPSNAASIKRIVRHWPKRPIWALRREDSKQTMKVEVVKALRHRWVSAQMLWEEGDEKDRAKVDLEDLRSAFKDDQQFQEKAAKIADLVLINDLIPVWRSLAGQEARRENMPAREQARLEYTEACGDVFTLVLVRFIVYSVCQIRNIAWAISVGFVMLLILFNSYNPRGPILVARFLAIGFAVLGFIVVRVFAQMERNNVLSSISHTAAGKLNQEFWLQMVALGGLPLLGVVAHLFPQISQFLVSWVAPGVQEVH